MSSTLGSERTRWALSEPDMITVFANAPTALTVTTLAGTITTANAALGQLLERDVATLAGTTLAEVTHPDDVADAVRRDTIVPAGGPTDRGQRRLLAGGGRVVWVSLSATRLPRAGGRPTHLIVHVDDVTERRRREAELAHRALHDPLTGLANRALLTDRITAAMAQLGRHARPSHLFYLDLNGFKGLNDRYGHAAGDTVLVQFAQRITGLLRVGDTAARLGGDEFAVLCEDAEPGVADTIAARLSVAAAEPFVVDGVAITLSAAIGDCPVRRGDPADLLREADQHMYRAKRRDCVTPGPAPTMLHGA
jgi:diguanylate cyclase (GGDEF)-like protein/PAS domain S-box-containing protein